jgi:hypothetical protein
MSPAMTALLARRLAAPKAFAVVTTYADGRVIDHKTETRAQAENYHAHMSPRIGRDLIDRETGKTVRVASMEVVAL